MKQEYTGNSIIKKFYKFWVFYLSPTNFNYWWNFGSIVKNFVYFQIIKMKFLTMHYISGFYLVYFIKNNVYIHIFFLKYIYFINFFFIFLINFFIVNLFFNNSINYADANDIIKNNVDQNLDIDPNLQKISYWDEKVSFFGYEFSRKTIVIVTVTTVIIIGIGLYFVYTNTNNVGNMDTNNVGNMDTNNVGNMDTNNVGNMDTNNVGNMDTNNQLQNIDFNNQDNNNIYNTTDEYLALTDQQRSFYELHGYEFNNNEINLNYYNEPLIGIERFNELFGNQHLNEVNNGNFQLRYNFFQDKCTSWFGVNINNISDQHREFFISNILTSQIERDLFLLTLNEDILFENVMNNVIDFDIDVGDIDKINDIDDIYHIFEVTNSRDFCAILNVNDISEINKMNDIIEMDNMDYINEMDNMDHINEMDNMDHINEMDDVSDKSDSSI
jgi:hypothetical protein